MTDVVAHKEALLSRLAELDERIHRIEHELETPHTKDVEDQALEVEGEEVLEALEQQSQSEVVRIQAALKRIREGVYGDCLSCGDRSLRRGSICCRKPQCASHARRAWQGEK